MGRLKASATRSPDGSQRERARSTASREDPSHRRALVDVPPTARGELAGDLAVAWSTVLTRLLRQLPPTLLHEVFHGSEPAAFRRALQHLNLNDRWRALRRDHPPREAIAEVAAELTRRLDSHEHRCHRCMVPGLIVFTWWARSARRCFERTSLSGALTAQPLKYGLEAVVTQLRARRLPDDAGQVHDALRRSPHLLERVVAGLLDAAVVGAPVEQLGEALDQWLGDHPNPDFRRTFKQTLRAFRHELDTRRRFSAEDRARIVLEGLRDDVDPAELCRREGLDLDVYHRWRREFVEAGRRRLRRGDEHDPTTSLTKGSVPDEARLQRVLIELLLENRRLKDLRARRS